MILAGLLKFALLVTLFVGLDKVSYHVPCVALADTTDTTGHLSGQVRYRPEGSNSDLRRTPRYELVLAENGTARLYASAQAPNGPWIQMLGSWTRTPADSLHPREVVTVYDCALLVGHHTLTDAAHCITPDVTVWRGVPSVEGW